MAVTASNAKGSSRSRKRSQRTRRRLLDAALIMFCENGVDATTIEEITEKADLGKGTFYRYFKNKEAAMVALVEQAMKNLVANMHPPSKPHENLETAVAHVIEALTSFYAGSPEEFLILFQGRLLLKLSRDTADDLEQPYMCYLEAIEKEVAPFLPQPVEAGKLRRFACAAAGFVSGFFSFATIGMTPDEMERGLGPLRHAFIASATSYLKK